jgi:hypothetical protein
LWAALLALAIALFLVLWQDARPAPQDPATADMVAAARVQLQHISQQHHALGMPAHAAVKAYLLAEIRAIGYEPQVQSAFSLAHIRPYAGSIDNILVRIPGTLSQQRDADKPANKASEANKPALLLASHYDSVPNSHGAADDGVSVVNMLQTMRRIKAGAALKNDVIFLFSDGEEAALLGANAFTAQHPWMQEVALVLNFDNHGNSGPILMFETSNGNSGLIQQFSQALPFVHSNSLLYEIYKAMPNNTDFTPFKQKGVAGLNFGMIETVASYHTAEDNAALLSSDSMAEQATIMLALTRRFGNADLTQLQTGNAVYFNFPGLGLVHYPASWAPGMALLLLVLALLLLQKTRKQQPVRPARTLLATPLLLLMLILVTALLHGAWQLLQGLIPGADALREVDPGHHFLLAWALLALLALAGLQKLALRWFSLAEQAFAAIWLWLVALLAISFLLPGASFVLAWPLLALLLAWGAIASIKPLQNPASALWLTLGASLVGMILFVPMVRASNIALGFELLAVPLVFVLLPGAILTPLTGLLLRGQRVGVVALGALLLCAVGTLATLRHTQQYPEEKQLFYAHNLSSDKAWWLSPNDEIDRATLTMFSAQATRKEMKAVFGPQSSLSNWLFWSEATTPWALKNTTLDVRSDNIKKLRNGGRELVLHLQGAPDAATLLLEVEGAAVTQSWLNDQPFTLKREEQWQARIESMPATGIILRLLLPEGKPFTLRITDLYYSIPPGIGKVSIPQAKGLNFSGMIIQSRDFP